MILPQLEARWPIASFVLYANEPLNCVQNVVYMRRYDFGGTAKEHL